MKVDVPDFYGKLEPYAFEDWLIAIKGYFDLFIVSNDRKICYARMELRGMHVFGGKYKRTITLYSVSINFKL